MTTRSMTRLTRVRTRRTNPRPTRGQRARVVVCVDLYRSNINYVYYYAERYMYCWKHSTFISPQKQSASFREDLPCRTPPFHIKNIPVRRTVVDQVINNQPTHLRMAWHQSSHSSSIYEMVQQLLVFFACL